MKSFLFLQFIVCLIFICRWACCVFAAVWAFSSCSEQGPLLVVTSPEERGLQGAPPQQLCRTGLVAVWHARILPDQGSNPCV